MTERLTRQASDAVCLAVRDAFQDVMAAHGPNGDWDVAFAQKVEEILGPFDKVSIGDFGVRFTRLQAAEDGYHDYVTLYF